MSVTEFARALEENDESKFRKFTNITNWLDFIPDDEKIDVGQLSGHKKYSSNTTTILCIANHYSRFDFVKKLLDYGLNSHLSDGFNETPLHKACRSAIDAIQKVDLLLSRDKDLLNRKNKRRMTPLHIAVTNIDHTVPQRLLEKGADVNAVCGKGKTPLHISSHYGLSNVVNIILLHPNTDVNIQDESGLTPLHFAARQVDHTIAKMLLEKGADANAVSKKFLSPLHVASHFGRINIVDILLSCHGIDVNLQDCNGDTAMHHASAKGYINILKKIKDSHDCIKFLTNKAGLTADQESPLNLKLLTEAQDGSASDVQALLNKGAIFIQDVTGETPLHKACRSNVEAFQKSKILISHDRKQIHLPNKKKLYPIHLASRREPEVLELLLKECQVNIPTPKGNTALAIAIFCNKTTNVRLLLKYPDIDLSINHKRGDSILHFAVYRGHPEILGLIVDHAKCQPNIQNNAEFTALHVAVQRKNISCVEILLRSKAININATDKKGNTAAHHASLNEYWEILHLIQSHPTYEFSVRNEEGKTVDQVNELNANFVEMCEIGSTFVLKRLLIGGTKLIRDASGRTCLHRACLSDIEPTEKCKLLLDIEPEMINSTDSSGETPLHVACKRRDSKLTTFLLGLPNIDANIKNNKHRVPLHVTVMHNKIENTVALLSHEKILVNIQDNRGDTASHIAAVNQSYAQLELLQAHPKFDTQITNRIYKTATQIWSPYGRLLQLDNLRWLKHRSVEVKDWKFMPSLYCSPLSLLGNNLYGCCGGTMFNYNLALEKIGSFAPDDIGYVHDMSGLKNAGLGAASKNGLYHLTLTGEIISTIASGRYWSVTTYQDKLYAVRVDNEHVSIEVYTMGESWNRVRTIQLPGRDHRVTVLVTSKAIYASRTNEHSVYVVSGDGHVMQTVGRQGNVEPGQLHFPRLCHSDDTDNVLIASVGGTGVYTC